MASKINVSLDLSITEFQKKLAIVQNKMQAFSKSMQDMGSTLTQNVSLPLAAVGAAAVKSFADLDKLERGLTAVMGSSEAAAEELTKLREVAKLPGLGFTEAVQGSVRLQAVGLSADEARNTLQAFGAAIAATGGGAQNLESVQYQLTQMISKNRILQEDFGILQENVPLLGKAVQAAFGTANIEQIRATGISAAEFNARMVEALQTLPEVQNATGGLGNAFENFGDSVSFSLAELGRTIATSINLEGILNGLSDALASIVGWFRQLSPSAQKTIVIFTAIVAAIGPVLFIIGKLSGAWGIMLVGLEKVTKGVKAARAAMLTFSASALALPAAILAIIAAVGFLYVKFESVRKVVNGVGQGFVELARLAKDSFSKIIQGIQQLKEGEFKAAASSFGQALGNLNPVELGKTFAVGFADGFTDSADKLTPAIDAIKKKVQEAAKFVVPATGGGGVTGGGGGGVAAPEQDLTEVSSAAASIAALAQKSSGLFKLIRTDLQAVTELTPDVTAQKDALLAYGNGIDLIAQKAAILGENPLAEQFSLTKSALESAIETFGVGSEAVAQLQASYAAFGEQVKLVNLEQEKQAKLGELISGAVNSIGQSFSDAIGGAIKFGEAMRRVITDVISLLIQELVISVVKNTANSPLGKLLGPAILPVAAAAGAAAGSLAKALLGKVKLANGGLAFGETLATVGDNPGAQTDPEVIAPLSKLKDYLNPGGGYIAEARISGNDLLILVNNAERRNTRIR